jgi:hypothetical protein
MSGPDLILNVLEVSGPMQARLDFVNAAAGPGFVDWRPDWYQVYERLYFAMAANVAPSLTAAERVAQQLRDWLWMTYERDRVLSEKDPRRQPFDLNALIPIPLEVLRAGYTPRGRDWLWANWGIAVPPRQVSYAARLVREAKNRVRHVDVFEFVTEDWSPWIALAAIRRRWPDVELALTWRLLEDSADADASAETAAIAASELRYLAPPAAA